MKVRATAKGYCGDMRRAVGDVFEIEENQYSEKWMEAVSEHVPNHSERGTRIGTGASDAITEEEAMRQVPKKDIVSMMSYDPLESAHTGQGVI